MKIYPIYELEEVWKGPMVRLSLMIAAFLISWAIMFFIPERKDKVVSNRTEYHAGIYAAPDFTGYSDVCRNL